MLQNSNFEELVATALERQFSFYPQLTLVDLYKNFFQGKFGPRHLISNADAAANYLDHELQEMVPPLIPDVEAIGWENRYVRVSLQPVKTGMLPKTELLAAFIESANTASPPNINDWIKEWKEIAAIIRKKYADLPNYPHDLKMIRNRLNTGKYDLHHSNVFNATYHPHYRVVSAAIFHAKLSGFLTKG